MIERPDVEQAAARIAGRVRRTPVLSPGPGPWGGALQLKLECLQVTGSFKARGALNRLLGLDPDRRARGVVTASGGNHGLAVAWAARLCDAPATVFLPRAAPAEKVARLQTLGARTVVGGEVWDDAHRAALERVDAAGTTYVHPFADPEVVAGQGTVGLELLEDGPPLDTVLVAIGGGGLAAGVGAALAGSGVRVIGVEPAGAPTLSRSLEAGEVVTLPGVTTRAGSLAPRRSDPRVLELVRRHVERVVLVSDDDMLAAAGWLWEEAGLAVELAGAATVAALRALAYRPAPGERVGAIVCGAGRAALDA